MNVKQLKTLVLTLPDEALVVIPGSDHSYSAASAEATTAVSYDRGAHICEDHGEQHNEAGGKIIPVLLIS